MKTLHISPDMLFQEPKGAMYAAMVTSLKEHGAMPLIVDGGLKGPRAIVMDDDTPILNIEPHGDGVSVRRV